MTKQSSSVTLSLIILTISFMLTVSCKQRKSLSSLRAAGIEKSSEFYSSIGGISSELGSRPKESNQEEIHSTGFVIGKDGTDLIGVTNRHVWEQCPKEGCFITFSDQNGKNWRYFKMSPYLDESGKHVISSTGALESWVNTRYLGKPFIGDYAVFRFTPNAGDSDLHPLPLLRKELNLDDVVEFHGYPGGIVAPGETVSTSMLVSGSGVVLYKWDLGAPTTIHSRPGASGSPILVREGKSFAVAGILFSGPQTSARQSVISGKTRSASNDARTSGELITNIFDIKLIQKNHPKLPLWKQVNWIDLSPKKADSLTHLKVSAAREDIDGEVSYLVNAKVDPSLEDWKNLLYFSGPQIRFLNESLIDIKESKFQFRVYASDPQAELPYFEYVNPKTAKVMILRCRRPDSEEATGSLFIICDNKKETKVHTPKEP